MLTPYNQVKEFHQAFDPVDHQGGKVFTAQQALFRTMFKGEELVEFLYAAANNDQQLFTNLVSEFQTSIDEAKVKIEKKHQKVTDPLVEQADALIDLLYFTYGSFVQMGVDPSELFSIVHQANMGKLFPDGQPHYHPKTGKVMKPDNWEKDFAPEEKIREVIKKQLK